MSFTCGSAGKESTRNAGDPGLIPELGRSAREEIGYPLQYSCLENPMDEGEWWAAVYRVVKSQTQLSDLTFTLSSVAQSCPTLGNPMNHSTPGLPVHHHLLELAQTPVHWVGDVTQPSCPLSSPSPSAFSLFQWVSPLHEVIRVLELQHQSLKWVFRSSFL